MTPDPSFTVNTSATQETGTTLVIGQSHFGLAGVTAADYLVRHLESTRIGHLASDEIPSIAPFENGVPRHPSRLYSLDGTSMMVLVGELFIPVGVARSYTDALMEWVTDNDVDELVVLHGVPFPHGPQEHEVFSVATPGYQANRLSDAAIQPLKGGVLDGVVGELVTRSLDATAPETGAFITPTHPPGPDIDASLKLLDALERLYGLDIDETELRQLGEELKQQYEQLADRMAALAEGDSSLPSHDYPEDRMYM